MGAARKTPAVAAEGGAPVRAEPLKAGFSGTQYYDDAEQEQLIEVCEARQPFRWYGPGDRAPQKVATFEREFAARMAVRYALAVTSGTAALQTALAALEVGPGDEVILPAWTWYSCYNAIVLAGALPVFAEIDDSFNLDPNDVAAKITPQTKVIMAVHLLGSPCDMGAILTIARQHRLRVLEDCAQGLGATYQGRPLGSLGDIGIFSMQLHKTITSGEGGAVVTDDPVLFERASRFHDLGALRPPHEALLGKANLGWFVGNQFRMNEFTGGVLLAQLRKLDAIVGDLRGHARRVCEGIGDLGDLRLRQANDSEGDLGAHVFLGFAKSQRRDEFMAAMAAENVPARPPSGSVVLPIQGHIERKVTVHPAWPSFTSQRGRSIRYGAECCPRTIDILDRYAGVALDPKFTPSDIDDIVAAIRKVWPKITGD
jgi:8-amino-3,8-dideoxy-alpha-D-manno-octulosonate transaminase